MEFLISDTPEALAENVARHFTERANAILKERDQCSVVLSGGSTPKLFLSRLAQEPYRTLIRWDHLHFFWGDERCLPPDHSESNFKMASEALLNKVPVLPNQVYRMPAEQQYPSNAADAYENLLRRFFNIQDSDFPKFDLVFLGMGSDGHTASLFPGSPELNEKRRWVIPTSKVHQKRRMRLSLTIPVLNNSKEILFVVQGADKAQTFKTVFKREPTSDLLPAQRIRPQSGSLIWFVDRLAAQELKQNC